MKLFLCSAGFDNERLIPRFLDLLDRPASGLRVLFIPTALNTQISREYLPAFREDLYKVGVTNSNIITMELDKPVPEDLPTPVDLIFVCPGDPEFLLNRVRESGFDHQLRNLLERDLPYIGISAGADILAANCPDGLNLIEHRIECHAENGSPDGPVKGTARTLYLTEDQALIIDGDRMEIVS